MLRVKIGASIAADRNRRKTIVALLSHWLLVSWCCLYAVGAIAHGGTQHTPKPAAPPQILAPGYAKLTFEAPEVGSYQLPTLGTASDGTVLDEKGKTRSLSQLLRKKPTLLSFIYTNCSDVNGCPLASFVLSKVAKEIEADSELRGNIQLISLSFDPQHDTPKKMAEYGAKFRPGDADWRFVTCENEETLAPILSDYNQRITKEYGPDDKLTGNISHILRVFLIDEHMQLRNIYSVSFLHAETIVNDFKTVLRESTVGAVIKTGASSNGLHGAGDDKSGYAKDDYETRSDYLPNRTGQPIDLLKFANTPPLGLPKLDIPKNNPLTVAKVLLGRKIFFDRRLSLNQTISCGMCHVPEQGFAHNELAMAVGFEGRTVRRNSPTMYNVGYHKKLFHDARDELLEHQIWQPLLARNEMANPSIGSVVKKFHELEDYAGTFEKAFDGERANIQNIGQAVASYVRTLVSGNSRFDQWKYGGQPQQLSATERQGFEIFSGKGQCTSCHIVGDESALFTDHKTHNTGIGYKRAMTVPSLENRRVLIAPGVFIDVDPKAVAESSEVPPADIGEYEITQNPADRWKYRTPTLRNIALTGPYMHDGSLETLEDVVTFYDRGGVINENLDPLIRPLNLTASERESLVEFLGTLTGDNVDELILDAFAVPVGNTVSMEQ